MGYKDSSGLNLMKPLVISFETHYSLDIFPNRFISLGEVENDKMKASRFRLEIDRSQQAFHATSILNLVYCPAC